MADNSICSVDDCSNPSKKAGLCFAHYERKRRYGSPVMGGPMQGPKGAASVYLRDVVLKHEGIDCLYWPFARSGASSGGGGRAQIKHGKTVRNVHRMVCEEVNGPPPTPYHQAAHTCGMGHKACVSPKHLVWKTPVENQADRIIHGTDIRGEKNVRAKLTAKDVISIRSIEASQTLTCLATKYGVSLRCISSIRNYTSWRSI